ncbi:hypothetical protein SAMN05444369_10473 [Capnocytophaga haemolytica]|uniref:Uncharacterized protein n=1 Tax=Capnocytophaga haemolytica TaxID=45243 RepID=A0AAX2H3N3_9FLAO|nr:hypothetical protein AXF12_08935 [Capnocytophaga haemolytica]SFN89177.1 hypothetical protein SAMN05444369_10473 [Capnocytophaga haemolytica]SNV16714.1 Uncharacterised protein [Capnocytophaga haemolytica]
MQTRKITTILEIIKNYNIKNKIRKNLKVLESYRKPVSDELVKVGCIIDMDAVRKVDPLLELIKFYGIRPENYIVLGYKKESEETHADGTPFLIDKEINWQGKIRNYHADRLAEQEYDLLINYFNEPKLPLLLLSSSIRAKLRIGFQGIDLVYNDIIIACNLQEEVVFAEEVKKVMNTIIHK